MPRNVRIAVFCSFVLHGLLILSARYRLSYDAYNHMFFGDHYRMDWWSLWEPRWYTGFPVNSYPPLVHQLIGVLSHVTGLEVAFALILWLVVAILPLAIYSFARIFTGKVSAGYAALGAAFLPSAYLTAHIFGQLPTLVATVIALFGAARLSSYLKKGGLYNLALTVTLTSTMMAAHHATLLLLPWLVAGVIVHLLTSQRASWQTIAGRLLVAGILSALAMLLVIWPFWDWGRMQSIQTAIDHASRHNFIEDPLAALIFFLPVYGPLMFFIPVALWLTVRHRLFSLGLPFVVLFLLGLGDTTPLPRLFFGNGWKWLTYDRFAFWASLTLLPFLGIALILFRRKRAQDNRKIIFASLAVASMIVGLFTTFVPLQPGAVDMRQIVKFLNQDGYSRWRYLTFGFGDQLALLSTLTTATTLDGSYHTARSLPELRTSGIGQIDTAFWLPNGLSALDPILQKSREYGVRWGFVNVSKYVPVLERNGWVKLQTLKDGVQVWENPEAVAPQPLLPPPSSPLASFSWGTLPILSLITSLSLGSLHLWHIRAEKILRSLYAFIVAFIPLSLGFWYYRTVSEFPHERVYFTYTDALFYLSDALMLLAVLLWVCTKIARPAKLPVTNYTPYLPHSISNILPFIFFLLVLLSILWSRDWRISLYVALHVMLILLFIQSLHDSPHAWKTLLLGFCAALSLQLITGIVGFIEQSTAFLSPLELKWPGMLDPSVRGAVIVQLPGGDSFLRAYGTLPHPNLLGGQTLLLLLGPIALFMRKDQPNNLALLLLIPGISLIAITFSRSSWLGLVVCCIVLVWKSKYFNRKRLAILLATIALSFVATLLPYHELVQARTLSTTSHAEEFSFIGRAWLNGEATKMIREYPLTGVGIGSFILELADRAGKGYVIEPAHNVLLLAGAELGIPGLLLVIALISLFAYHLFIKPHPTAILAGAVITGLAIISLFDHYLWTLAPGRLLLGLAVGLFARQDSIHEA